MELTHEAIDSRLLDILRETDELFQSGQIKCPMDSKDVDLLISENDKHYTHLVENLQNNVVNNDFTKFGHLGAGIQPIKSINGSGHFFSNPILSTNPNPELGNVKSYNVNPNGAKVLEKPNFGDQRGLRDAPVKCVDFSIVSNWDESQKEVFYRFADKLREEYQRLQQQLYTQFRLDSEKNINVMRMEYSNTIDELQRDLINLKAFHKAFGAKEEEYEEKIAKYEAEVGAGKQEIERLYGELQGKREHILALNKQLHEYENAITELKYGKTALEETVAERNRQLESVEDELSQSINKSELEHRKYNTLNQNLLENNALITTIKGELATFKKENDKLNDEIERLNGVIKNLHDGEANMNKRLAEAAAANAALVAKLDNMNLEKSALYSRIDEITSGYEKQISICNRKINQLEIQIDAKK